VPRALSRELTGPVAGWFRLSGPPFGRQRGLGWPSEGCGGMPGSRPGRWW